jgi:hypothetical protein
MRRIFTLLGLCLLLAFGPTLVLADETLPVTGPGAEAPLDGSWSEAWWGVAGAALCGGGIRLAVTVPVLGMNPYVLAATIGGCVLALMDVAS